MKIKIFGKLTDIFKSDEYIVQQIYSVEELKNKIEKDYPELKSLTYLIVINNNISKDGDIINLGDKIALLPPYSGG